MEDITGYEDLFSTDEWDSLDLIEWEPLDDLSPEGLPHQVTIYDPPGELSGNDKRFEVECELCGVVASATDRTEAEAIAGLHESLQAEVVEQWPHRCELNSNGSNYEVTCPTCGAIGSADTEELGRFVGRLHENTFELAGIAAERRR